MQQHLASGLLDVLCRDVFDVTSPPSLLYCTFCVGCSETAYTTAVLESPVIQALQTSLYQDMVPLAVVVLPAFLQVVVLRVFRSAHLLARSFAFGRLYLPWLCAVCSFLPFFHLLSLFLSAASTSF